MLKILDTFGFELPKSLELLGDILLKFFDSDIFFCVENSLPLFSMVSLWRWPVAVSPEICQEGCEFVDGWLSVS